MPGQGSPDQSFQAGWNAAVAALSGIRAHDGNAQEGRLRSLDHVEVDVFVDGGGLDAGAVEGDG